MTAAAATEPRSDAYDVVVVGSGLGGVSAAALLAKNGRKVLCVEQGDGAGGFAHGFKRDNYKFDSAIRVIAEGEMVEGLLSYLGVKDRCKLTLIDHMYRVYFPGYNLFAPIGLKEFMEAHIREFPQEAEGIRKFFGLRRQMFLETAQLPMQLSPGEMADAMARFPTLFKYRTATLDDVMNDFFKDPRLKALCSALWPYMGTTPKRLSFFAYSQFLGVLIDGPFYCQGTFQNLVDAFVTALERNGGELVLKTAVTKILVEGGKVQGVKLSTGRGDQGARGRLQRRRAPDLRAAGRGGAPAGAVREAVPAAEALDLGLRGVRGEQPGPAEAPPRPRDLRLQPLGPRGDLEGHPGRASPAACR